MCVLRNRYYGFRHGQSRANDEGIIVSDPALGTVEYGLTEEGRRQVVASLKTADVFDSESVLFSSDFRRARETAEIIRSELGCAEIVFDVRLRERFFGDWEGKRHEHYSRAWKQDEFDPEREYHGAESSASVQRRMWAVIESLEQQMAGKTIVLVSHGDPLMLLQTAFLDLGPSRHRSLPYIETAGWRLLNP
ncbi:histidine phosphatase family protein [Pontiella agarivorans]|uniref:Histidine phosphatase family protein n=1 Tax=Pontiella agarivorans TaxID=3038953 RepID=A0ABU5MZE2_9BACT|nr:histidine phosphatase family protein [Pontiella agarivorans]MDZ8119336.1 histidine phosphatase family protein [Pontiella agarivorans]